MSETKDVRFTRDRRLPGHRYSRGDVAELPSGLADALVTDGYAEPAKGKRGSSGSTERKSKDDPGAEKR